MNKKAELSLTINAIVVLILAITLLGLCLAFLRGEFEQPFNPETSVCTEFGKGMFDRDLGVETKDLEAHKKDEPNTICNKPLPNEPNTYRCSVCSEWRPKTICELNPNNSTACVCDEKRITHVVKRIDFYCIDKIAIKLCRDMNQSFYTSYPAYSTNDQPQFYCRNDKEAFSRDKGYSNNLTKYYFTNNEVESCENIIKEDFECIEAHEEKK